MSHSALGHLSCNYENQFCLMSTVDDKFDETRTCFLVAIGQRWPNLEIEIERSGLSAKVKDST